MAILATLVGCFFTSVKAEQLTFQGKPVIDGVWRGEAAQFIGGEILVMFYAQDAPAADIAKMVGGRVVRGVEADGFAKIEVPLDADIPALCDKLYGDPRIRFAEPNFLTTITEWNPTDTYYANGTQWSLRNTGQEPPAGVPDADIDANWAWDITRGSSSVILAILDTGIDMDTTTMTPRHNDLDAPGKIIQGQDCVGDGHGVADFQGHGTHVAGIAAAEINNAIGVAGVAGDCKILVVQVFNSGGSGTVEGVRDGINYAVSYQANHLAARVIMNYSGGGNSPSAIMFTALDSAQTHGVPFVTTSGNYSSSTCHYPCQFSSDLDNIICVGATNPWDQKSAFSNYCNDINVVAPGGTDLPMDENDVYSCYPPNSYAYDAGTSMAAPHVTGICGLVASQSFSITPVNLRTLIQNTADDEVGTITDDPQGYDNQHGWGRVNAWSALMHLQTTPYMQQDQRFSNTFTAAGQYKGYRLAPPSNGKWEIAAVRPNAAINTNIQWLSTNGSTILASSSLGADAVDFVLANNRSTTGSDHYAKIIGFSGSDKYSAEYQQATESYIGSMYKDDFHWKSSHVVEIWELYLLNGHYYNFKTAVSSGEVDVGIALVGRSGSGAYYTGRSSAVFATDLTGSGGTEATSQTISTGTGWYAFVVWSNNGRNGVMDIFCEEKLYSNTSVKLSEYDNVSVKDGYFFESISSGSTMGIIGVRTNYNFDYSLYLYNNENDSGSYLARSVYGYNLVEFVMFDKAAITPGWYYPKVEHVGSLWTGSGYTIRTEDTDEFLSLGTNGPFAFNDSSVARAWDISLTSGTEYQFLADRTSGSLNTGIALYRKDGTFKEQWNYIGSSYSAGSGADKYFNYPCTATGNYTFVLWSQNGLAGNVTINVTTLPNLTTYVPTGWSYQFVPRNASGATSTNCLITDSLPGNTNDTYLNFAVRNGSANPVPATSFYNQLYLDNATLYQLARSTGVAGYTTLYFNNYTAHAPICGGKHTIELRQDGTNTIAEYNETDNNVARQFIWTPYTLSFGVPVVRSAPPPYSAMWAQPNCDGFRFNSGSPYAVGVAICPQSLNEDYDLYLYDDYTGSLSGFDSLRSGSYYGYGVTDFVIRNTYASSYNYYPGVVGYAGPDTGNYVIEYINAYDHRLYATDDAMQDTLGENKIFRVYEARLFQDSSYTITLDNVSGTADLALALYGGDIGFYSRSQYLAYSNHVGADEEITFVPTVTHYYAFVVFKPDCNQLALTNIYDISLNLTPPNLVTTVPNGWSYEFVPRNSGGATVGNCLITATLPGNTTNTYLNFCAKNEAMNPVPAVTFYDRLYLDGAFFFEQPWSAGLAGDSTLYHLNLRSTNTIFCGKHTIELRLDGSNTIGESNETDNSVRRQFIWSPLVLVSGTTIGSPPPSTWYFTQPDCDGFKFTRTGAYAYGVAIASLAATDIDLLLYDDYVGSTQGFDSLRSYSFNRGPNTDYVIATYDNVAETVYPGVRQYSGLGLYNYVIDVIDAAGRLLNPLVDATRIDTLSENRLIKVYETYLAAGTNYTITLDNTSGTADLDLTLYGPNYGYYRASDYVAASQTVSPDEELTYTPSVTAYFVIAVTQKYYMYQQNIYQLTVRQTPPNLTYGTPTGWSYPVVPRNAAGADSNNCVLTMTLPGNTANTYLNFNSYNQGPNPTTTAYSNYIYVDSVSWFGLNAINPHPVGVYSKHLNALSSNTIRGGRHTMAVKIDRNNAIAESNENDNWYPRQFVWSPYLLTNNTTVTRSAPPAFGYETYPNCDGFETTWGYWAAVGIIPYNASDNYNLRLHAPWTESQTGFGTALATSEWGMGESDIVIGHDLYETGAIFNAGVVQNSTNPGTGYFVIQQSYEQYTWFTPGTYGPFTLPANRVLGLWEVYPSPQGAYYFQVDVVSGTADIGTSLYDGNLEYFGKSDYFTGGFSNSAGSGGDESFSIWNPYASEYFAWMVWKVGSVDRNSAVTFYLTWGPISLLEPAPVNDLVIERLDSTSALLSWSPVTQDTSGQPLTVDYYRIHRNTNPDFVPSPSDSIGYTPGGSTVYMDQYVIWNNPKYFYKVIAVDTDGVMVSGSGGNGSSGIITGQPPRSDAPEAVRTRYRQ